MKTSAPRPVTTPRPLAAAMLDAHPLPTIVVDAASRVVYANVLAKRLNVREGLKLGESLACVDAKDEACGQGQRCVGCGFRRLTTRALAGTAGVERGFILRGSGPSDPEDLHILAFATPLECDGAAHAVIALADVNGILGDPGVLNVCEGCGRVQDEEGAWHPLHLYFEDRLGLETAGDLCDACRDEDGHGTPCPAARRPAAAVRGSGVKVPVPRRS